MPIKTRRWNDPREPDDGVRILVCRYRPRALPKKDETWDLWWKQLSPSVELHADIYGKHGDPIPWDEFRRRYLQEMEAETETLGVLVEKLREGKTFTLLCSSACADPSRCHRTLLKELLEQLAASAPGGGDAGGRSGDGAAGEPGQDLPQTQEEAE
jgi:uncharacterized protein YeaO (DUF488 family)